MSCALARGFSIHPPAPGPDTSCSGLPGVPRYFVLGFTRGAATTLKTVPSAEPVTPYSREIGILLIIIIVDHSSTRTRSLLRQLRRPSKLKL